MNLSLEQLDLLLLIAALVAIVTRRLGMPYAVGLVAAGVILAFLPTASELPLSKELVFSVFLPPLVFEAALYIQWKELRRDLPVIATLASVGVALSAVITTFGMHWLAGWAWGPAVVFGVLIAATDPVSVIAIFKEAGVHGRLRLLVEAESLFNDGVAAVLFVIALAFATGGELSTASALQTFVLTIAGGVAVGLIVGFALMLLAGRTEDHLVELSLTTVIAYGAFLLAEHFHWSGVIASLTAGLVVGNYGTLGPITSRGRDALESFWEFAAFIVNSLIFILIGVREAQQNFAVLIVPIVIAIVFVTLGRAIAIYPMCALFSASRLRIERPHQHILFWGGLRGALALALALGLPEDMPRREDLVTVAFAVVAFSIFVQGMTMRPLLRRLRQI